MAIICLTTGCALFGLKPKSGDSGVDADMQTRDLPHPTQETGASSPDDRLVVVHLAFDVTRILIPSDEWNGAVEDVWRGVDEMRLSPSTSSFLAGNGLRVGVAQQHERDNLIARLDERGARFEHMNQTVRNGAPLTLDLGPLAGNQVVFMYRADGKLVGESMEDAIKRVHVDYDVALGADPTVTLRVTPELFKESPRRQWARRDGDIRYEKEYQGRLYRELAVQLELEQDEVLVVGPSSEAGSNLTVGRRILRDGSAGRSWETVVCLEPKLFRQNAAAVKR